MSSSDCSHTDHVKTVWPPERRDQSRANVALAFSGLKSDLVVGGVNTEASPLIRIRWCQLLTDQRWFCCCCRCDHMCSGAVSRSPEIAADGTNNISITSPLALNFIFFRNSATDPFGMFGLSSYSVDQPKQI